MKKNDSHTVLELIHNTLQTDKKIKGETDKNESRELVKKHIRNGWPINKQKIPMKIIKYWHIRDEIQFVEGLILKN